MGQKLLQTLLVPAANIDGSYKRPDTQNNKQIAYLEQEPEILREEPQQVPEPNSL